MRKFLFFSLMLMCVSMMTTGCSSCQSEKQQQDSVSVSSGDIDGVLPEITASVENVISLDRQDMFKVTKDGDYRWFETTVMYSDYLDDDCDASEVKILSITNTFQCVTLIGNGADTKVYIYETTGKGKTCRAYDTFMLEDEPLNDEDILLTFDDAYNKLMEANITKPHSMYCVLRKPVGPMECNAQYIFGNRKTQVFVDAVTGDVSSENPAFAKGFKMPLGEWP